MKRSLYIISAIAGCCLTALASVADLPVVEHNGVLCHIYKVQPKETVYSLSNKLGVTAEELVAANPEIKDGLKAHTVLYIPVKESEMRSQTVSHKVEKGETIYGLSKRYGITTEELIAQNPQLRDGGLRNGMTLTVTSPATVTATPAATTVSPTTESEDGAGWYTVKDGETFYSIARKHNVTVSQLEAANPMTGVLHAGDRLAIPSPMTEQPAVPETAQVSVPQPAPGPVEIKSEDVMDIVAVEETPAPETVTAPDPAPARAEKHQAVAVMLPFMLTQKTPDKSAANFTEFFKGFMLAADSLRNEGNPVDIYAFDTAGSTDTVMAILRRPELKNVSMIIAPNNEEQLAALAAWGRDNGVAVMNPFLVRDRSHLTNPAVMQANMPHDMMYDRAIDGLISTYPRHKIVVIARNDGPTDHQEFIDELHLRLDQTGNPPMLLTYTDELKASDLAGLPAGEPCVFIPVSGKQAELKKILPALNELKAAAVSPDDVMLFGYPEWLTYRGQVLEGMQSLNTMIYSRFYNDSESLTSKDVEENFNRWFGTPMQQVQPRQGLFGFDTGMMVIRALRHNKGDFNAYSPIYHGVQNGFDFRRASSDSSAGWVNNVLFFVNFRPGGMIERTVL